MWRGKELEGPGSPISYKQRMLGEPSYLVPYWEPSQALCSVGECVTVTVLSPLHCICTLCTTHPSTTRSLASHCDTIDTPHQSPLNNGKEIPRLDLTSLTTPGQQIHKFHHPLTANPCDWLPCRRAALPLVSCMSATSPSC